MDSVAQRGFEIDGRAIGPDQPPYIIAEMSANHLGELARAHAIIDAAADAGADAIKLQTYTPDGMTLDTGGPGFDIESGPWRGSRLYELYAAAQTPRAWHGELFSHAAHRDIAIFSSPFDMEAVELLESLGAPAYKIASFELGDHELLRAVALTGKPIIASTGMASPDEIREAAAVLGASGNQQRIFLHCISGYPAPAERFNLRFLDRLAAITGRAVGLSDHSPGSVVAIAAVARGACVVEKHLTLSRADGGPDAGFSLEPHELRDVVQGCRIAWRALGDGSANRPDAETSSRAFRRSLYAVSDIGAGETLSSHNVRSIRPGHGLPPRDLPTLLGRRAACAIARGTPLAWDLVA